MSLETCSVVKNNLIEGETRTKTFIVNFEHTTPPPCVSTKYITNMFKLEGVAPYGCLLLAPASGPLDSCKKKIGPPFFL